MLNKFKEVGKAVAQEQFKKVEAKVKEASQSEKAAELKGKGIDIFNTVKEKAKAELGVEEPPKKMEEPKRVQVIDISKKKEVKKGFDVKFAVMVVAGLLVLGAGAYIASEPEEVEEPEHRPLAVEQTMDISDTTDEDESDLESLVDKSIDEAVNGDLDISSEGIEEKIGAVTAVATGGTIASAAGTDSDPLTIDNCPDLKDLLGSSSDSDKSKAFAKKYSGKTIYFAGSLDNAEQCSGYNSRFNIIFTAGNYSASSQTGPTMYAKNASASSCSGVDICDNCWIQAHVYGYDANFDRIELSSIEVTSR